MLGIFFDVANITIGEGAAAGAAIAALMAFICAGDA